MSMLASSSNRLVRQRPVGAAVVGEPALCRDPGTRENERMPGVDEQFGEEVEPAICLVAHGAQYVSHLRHIPYRGISDPWITDRLP